MVGECVAVGRCDGAGVGSAEGDGVGACVGNGVGMPVGGTESGSVGAGVGDPEPTVKMIAMAHHGRIRVMQPARRRVTQAQTAEDDHLEPAVSVGADLSESPARPTLLARSIQMAMGIASRRCSGCLGPMRC